MKKKLTMIAALALAVCIGIGGTLAYLTDKTDSIVNTFTIGNVDISLNETTGTLTDGKRVHTLVPGTDIDKDPKVTVTSGSADCYLFVKVDKQTDVDTYLDITMDSAWTALGDSYPGVYYYNTTIAQGTALSVFANDKVGVKATVNAIAPNAQIDVTITAYAIQTDGITQGSYSSVYEAAWNAGAAGTSAGGWATNA